MVPKGVYCVAVSGGVDSVVLLDMLVRQERGAIFIVAHFDHGVRPDSADDAKFVRGLAEKYGLRFEVKREELGPSVSEDHARRRRYAFLRSVAKKYQAKIITAHHADDVIETIAINIVRGTGWRGLAVLNSPDIVRPLLHTPKNELQEYAQKHGLPWRNDSTNASDKYLRNRLRTKLKNIDTDSRLQLLALRDHQVSNAGQIAKEAQNVLGNSPYSRHLFIMCNEGAAVELLRAACMQVTGKNPLARQLRRAVLAIKTAAPGTQHDVGDGVRLEFTRTEFVVKAS